MAQVQIFVLRNEKNLCLRCAQAKRELTWQLKLTANKNMECDTSGIY